MSLNQQQKYDIVFLNLQGLSTRKIHEQIGCSQRDMKAYMRSHEYRDLKEHQQEVRRKAVGEKQAKLVASAMDQIQLAINQGDTKLAYEVWKHSGAAKAGAAEAFNELEDKKHDGTGLTVLINLDGDGLSTDKDRSNTIVQEIECRAAE